MFANSKHFFFSATSPRRPCQRQAESDQERVPYDDRRRADESEPRDEPAETEVHRQHHHLGPAHADPLSGQRARRSLGSGLSAMAQGIPPTV